MRLTRMTVAQAYPWTQVSGAYTMVPVWTWWVASVVTVPQDTQVCTVRQTSMSVAQVPAMRHIPGTACKIQVVTSTASAILASQVSMTHTLARNLTVFLLMWLIFLHLLVQDFAVRLLCPLVSPSRVSMEASAVPAQSVVVG